MLGRRGSVVVVLVVLEAEMEEGNTVRRETKGGYLCFVYIVVLVLISRVERSVMRCPVSSSSLSFLYHLNT